MESIRFRRIFGVIALIVERGPQSLSQISNRISIPTSSTHDLLKAMSLAGILRASGKDYELGPMTYKMAFDIQGSFSIVNVASPELEKLAEQIGFDVYLAVQSGLHVMYAARFRGKEGAKILFPLGNTLYRHATAAGKTFAAFDPIIQKSVLSSPLKKLTPKTIVDPKCLEIEFTRIKKHRISVSNEESFTGIMGLSTPIIGADGRIVAATHISAFKVELNSVRIKELCAVLAVATKKIEGLIEAGSGTEHKVKVEKLIRDSNYLKIVKSL